MSAVVTGAEARRLDEAVIEGLGLPGLALMELASKGLAEVVRRECAVEAARGIVVVCGRGNNGGDGFGAARWLKSWGFPVAVLPVEGERTPDCQRMADAAERAGVPSVTGLGDCGVIVDALLGTGLSRPIDGAFLAHVREIARHPALVVAVDLPTGLSADTGAVLGAVAPAQHTVTFGCAKLGHFGAPGGDMCGQLHIVDLGFGALKEGEPAACLVSGAQVAARWPRRRLSDHKSRAGHLFVLAGSEAMAGAAVLACRGALAGGVGLVTLCTPRAALHRLHALPPEVMVRVCGEGAQLVLPDPTGFSRATALAVGPGIGGGAPLSGELRRGLSDLWRRHSVAMVYDADALQTLAPAPSHCPRVLTPHSGEAGRLLGVSSADVEHDRFGAVRRLAGAGATALLKGRHTLVACQGQPTLINATGNPLLATAGSGDVLTGLIGALLARGLDGRSAASMAAYAHGLAAERLAERCLVGVGASDLADALPGALNELLVANTDPASLP